MRIGIFDSGIGGEAIARDLARAFSDSTIMTVNDRKNVPYGSRKAEEIIRLTNTAIQPLLLGNYDYIVIACNTATAVAIEWLRAKYPSQVFIGLEPMVKPAALLTHSKVVAICATPATLASDRYNDLKKEYIDITCIEPDCASWATMIEDSQVHESYIRQEIESSIAQGADVIVLACTHYHWIRELIETIVRDRAIVIDPSQAIIDRIRLLEVDSQPR